MQEQQSIQFCQMDRKIDTTLEERLSDIDEFIQSELGFPTVSHNSESVTVEELYSISSLFREAGDELLGEQKLYLGVAIVCVGIEGIVHHRQAV